MPSIAFHLGAFVAAAGVAAAACSLSGSVDDLGRGGPAPAVDSPAAGGAGGVGPGGSDSGSGGGGGVEAVQCVPKAWTYDGDGDGHGAADVPAFSSCVAPVGCPVLRPDCPDPAAWRDGLAADDCDDADPETNPDAWDGPAYRPRATGIVFPGLRAEYTAGGVEPVVRVDKTLQFNFREGPPLEGFPADGFRVSWTGKLVVGEEAEYRFCAYGDDVLRVEIDGEEAVADGADPGNTITCASRPLKPGVEYVLVASMVDDSGYSDAEVWLTKASEERKQPLTTLPDPAFVARPEHCRDQKDQNCRNGPDDDAIDDGEVQCSCALPCPP